MQQHGGQAQHAQRCAFGVAAMSEMIPVTWPEFGNMHAFAPLDQAEGYPAQRGATRRKPPRLRPSGSRKRVR